MWNNAAMNHSGASLGDFFRSYVDRGEPLVLATIVATSGSTYRKAGAQMLIAGDGRAAGLLSGGCVEADLMERARAVLATGVAARVEYDTRTSDDLIWGIGLGCEGAMSILLTRLTQAEGYQPFAFVEEHRAQHRAGRYALVVESRDSRIPLGAWSTSPIEGEGVKTLMVEVELPPRLLVLGAGPDAMPLVEIAGLMSWHVTVLDHRPAYAINERFPRARRVMLHPAGELSRELAARQYDAAVVMSHHLLSDQAYLAALAGSNIPYIGLLGPAPRRIRLMNEIGEENAAALGARLFGPIGLDIGAKTPETIALAIVSEIQAVLAGRPGGSFSRAG